jgi:hypothetical protein
MAPCSIIRFPVPDSMNCLTCTHFPGDSERMGEDGETSIVCCEDSVIRCVDILKGCAWYEQDQFSDVTEVD